MNKAEQFVSMALLGRDLAHLAHWRTKKYAEHKTLRKFYEGLLDLIDSFVEQHQGAYGKRMEITRSNDDNRTNIRDVLEYQLEWIEMYRYQICSKDESALQNTIDEILRLYQSTMYLLSLE